MKVATNAQARMVYIRLDGKHRTTKLCCRTIKNGPLIEGRKDTVI